VRSTKIVFIGAGSGSFGASMIADAVLTPELKGSTLVLVDIDPEKLAVMTGFARRLSDALGTGLHVEGTVDRAQALPEAEFVITSIGMKNMQYWQQDWRLCRKWGIKQVWGGQAGPSGLGRCIREIPTALAVARAVERLCPKALILNFTNPEGYIIQALSRYANVHAVGLCHGIMMGYDSIGKITGIPPEDLQGIAAGTNHFGWFLDIRRKSTGEDAYPLLREANKSYDPDYYPLVRKLFDIYGLYPYPDDPEVAESVAFGWEFCGFDGYNFAAAAARREVAWRWISGIASGAIPIPASEEAGKTGVVLLDGQLPLRRSRDFAFPLIISVVEDRHLLIPAVNIRNDGLITNVPRWAVVEIPAIATAAGIKGIKVGLMPQGIAALLNAQVHMQSLFVDAAVLGSRELALQGLLADPQIDSVRAAEGALDELLQTYAPILPQFAR
jgi:alpha-galactosidase